MFPLRCIDKDQSHVIGGLKAAISNPNTSTDAKEHAAERLKDIDKQMHPLPSHDVHHHELGTHQIAGYKATISSSWDSLYLVSCHLKLGYSFTDPNTSEEAKEKAHRVLEAEGEDVPPVEPSHPASAQDQHTRRVAAGYKAALHSTSPGFLRT